MRWTYVREAVLDLPQPLEFAKPSRLTTTGPPQARLILCATSLIGDEHDDRFVCPRTDPEGLQVLPKVGLAPRFRTSSSRLWGLIQEVCNSRHALGNTLERGALVHTDAAQSVGKVPVNVNDLGVDLLSVAGHKLYAPKGVGALYVRRGTRLNPVIVGASHERGLRPSTENVASIVGLGTACATLRATLKVESGRILALRERLWSLLSEGVPGLRLNGHPVERLPNTLNVVFPVVRSTTLLGTASGVAASAGSACHEGSETPSPVLKAMGLSDDDALGSVRLSVGRLTTGVDIAAAAAGFVAAWRVLQDT